MTISNEQLNQWIQEARVPDLVSSDVFLRVAHELKKERQINKELGGKVMKAQVIINKLRGHN